MLDLYYKVQKEIRTGDHIGWESKGVIGWLIRQATEDTINHSSMAIRLNYEGLSKRRFEIGALNRGLEFHMLSKRLELYKGKVYWYPLKDQYNDLRPRIAVNIFGIVDVKYDYGSLFKNAFGRVSTNISKFFCSEACNWVWNKSGVYTEFPICEKAPTPADIDRFKIFKDKVRIL